MYLHRVSQRALQGASENTLALGTKHEGAFHGAATNLIYDMVAARTAITTSRD